MDTGGAGYYVEGEMAFTGGMVQREGGRGGGGGGGGGS